MVQVFFVMLFFPVVMNALQYYIIDSFIKEQTSSNSGSVSSEDGDEDSIEEHGQTRRRRSRSEDNDGAHDANAGNDVTRDGAEIKICEGKGRPKLKVEAKKLDEYDPLIDGEGSGSSGEPDNPLHPSVEGKAKTPRHHANEP